MTKVNVLVAEPDGSAACRLVEPAEALRRAGYDVEVHQMWPSKAITPREADVYVLNRPIRTTQLELVRYLRESGKTVVVDMDDDLDHLVPEHSLYGRFDTTAMNEACRLASIVTVSTPALLRQYGYGHGVVVPNAIPAGNLSIERPDEHPGTWVGWYGTVASHPNDLQASHGGIARAVRRTSATFAYMGSPSERDLIKHHLGLAPQDNILGAPFCMTSHLGSNISRYDVGVIPLQDCRFNYSKSWLKGIEMASVGIPFVASPTPEYESLAALGVGVLATTRNQWTNEVTRLVKDLDYRAQLAANGRDIMADFTFDACATAWADAWTCSSQRPFSETIKAVDEGKVAL